MLAGLPGSKRVIPVEPGITLEDPLDRRERRAVGHRVEQHLGRPASLLDRGRPDDDGDRDTREWVSNLEIKTATRVMPARTANDAQRSDEKCSASASSAALPPWAR